MMSTILFYICFLISFHNIKALSGDEASSPSQFPYHVSIQDSFGNFRCSGTLIRRQWVLTAAHCTESGNLKNVVLGSINIDGKGGIVKNILKVIRHNNYDPQTRRNDIALIKIDIVQYNNIIQRVRIPNYSILPGKELTATAWGSRNTKGPIWPILCFVKVHSIPYLKCRNELLPKNIFTTNLCTLKPEGITMCPNDDAGPLVANGRVHALMSWTQLLCDQKTPDVNTYVSQYSKWIADNVIQ